MPIAYVYWESAGYDMEHGIDGRRKSVHQGILTTDHEAAPGGLPILVEEVTGNLYRPEDLPPETIVYVESAPGDLPEIAQLAKRAGYRVEKAGD